MNEQNQEECRSLTAREDLLQVVIDGAGIQTVSDFMDQIGKALHFPTECAGKYARFEDFIQDLSWLPADQGVCIRITGYAGFLQSDEEGKAIIEEIFQEEVLPFWETEVTKYVKGGKPREFYIIVS